MVAPKYVHHADLQEQRIVLQYEYFKKTTVAPKHVHHADLQEQRLALQSIYCNKCCSLSMYIMQSCKNKEFLSSMYILKNMVAPKHVHHADLQERTVSLQYVIFWKPATHELARTKSSLSVSILDSKKWSYTKCWKQKVLSISIDYTVCGTAHHYVLGILQKYGYS